MNGVRCLEQSCSRQCNIFLLRPKNDSYQIVHDYSSIGSWNSTTFGSIFFFLIISLTVLQNSFFTVICNKNMLMERMICLMIEKCMKTEKNHPLESRPSKMENINIFQLTISTKRDHISFHTLINGLTIFFRSLKITFYSN